MTPLRFAYYPGCAAEATAREADRSTRAIAPLLGKAPRLAHRGQNAPASGGFQIAITFTPAGAKRFAFITGANIGNRLAIDGHDAVDTGVVGRNSTENSNDPSGGACHERSSRPRPAV